MKKWVCLVLIILSVALLAGCSRQEAPVVEGKTAPDFTLKDLAGRQVRLSDYRGKVVLLNFWATWCPPCREEIPSMVRLNQVMADKPFKKSGSVLPALLDTDHAVSKRYGTTGVPETFVLDKKGVIMKKVIGGMDWSDPQVIAYLNEIMQQ